MPTCDRRLGGKTFIFSTILKGAHALGNPCVMAVSGTSLVSQASDRLKSMGVPHGVKMATDKRRDDSQLVQICSIDTLTRRDDYPPAKVVVVDEAHLACSNKFKKFLSHYEDAIWISVTATPWVECGLGHLATDVVYPISLADLTEQGYLVPARYFVPTKFDSSGISTKMGDFDDNSAIKAFESQAVYGDVVANYKRHCIGECTWVFAINRKHAYDIQTSFTNAGIRSVVIVGDDSLEDRRQILDKEDLVISIGTLTTGVDVPRLRNVILCRPTKSRNLYVQILGRATRPYEGKTHFRVFDHVGNVFRHGFIVDESVTDLAPKIKSSRKSSSEGKASVKVCPDCLAAVALAVRSCECGHIFSAKSLEIKSKQGDLVEIGTDIKSRFNFRAEYYFQHQWSVNGKIGYVWNDLIKEFGERYTRDRYMFYRKLQDKWKKWESGEIKPPKPKGHALFGFQ